MKLRDRIKEFKRLPAAALRPNPRNWRTHPAAQKDALKGLLAEVGIADACIARELPDGTYQLIDGHLRTETMFDQEVPVLILDVTEEEADKILLTLDPLAGMAGADKQGLDALLRQVESENPSVQALLEKLAAENNLASLIPGTGQGAVDPDDVPSPPDAAITQPGDLWILGNHRLLCGDSSKAEDVDWLLDGATIQLVNTDPPYNVKVEPRSNNAIAAGLSSFPADAHPHYHGFDLARDAQKGTPTHKKLRAKDRPLANDFVSDEDFERMLLAWFGNMARVLEPGRGFYIWGGYANVANYPPALKACGLYHSQCIIWVKEHPVLTRKDYMGNHEWCFYGWKEGAGHKWMGPTNATDVWSVKKVNPQSMIHLTEKPVELAARAMEHASKPGENVLDLFGGSGSTLIAAQQSGRNAYLMELDQLYCDVIVARYENFAGKKAVRVPAVAHTVAQGGPSEEGAANGRPLEEPASTAIT